MELATPKPFCHNATMHETLKITVAFAMVATCMAHAFAMDSLPSSAHGMFVQRKVLADVDVTLVSKGTFRFEKGRFFEWNTRDPVESLFLATPTNYSFTVGGRATVRPLDVDVSSVKSLFAVKEMKEFVESVKTEPASGFPRKVRVAFKNGDRLEIDLTTDKATQSSCSLQSKTE